MRLVDAALPLTTAPDGLGIISATTLSAYPKAQDTRAYALGLTVAVLSSLAAWAAWSWLTRAAPAPPEAAEAPVARRPWSWRGIALLLAVLVPGLLRFDLATNGWDAPYTFYSEEGEALAWAHVVQGGGVLSRDVYCLYGPLATLPIVAAFMLSETSVRVWRLAFYALDGVALVAAYLLLRETARTRVAAWLGVLLIFFHRMWPMPAMSWSLVRTGLGIGAIALLARALRTGRTGPLAASGAVVGLALFFSQEAGLAAGIAIVVGIGIDAFSRREGWRPPVRRAAALAAGCTAVVAVVLAWMGAEGAAGATLANLAGFARLRMLGHGAQPFPSPLDEPWAYVAPAVYAVTAFHVGIRLLRGGRAEGLGALGALAAYGAILFASPLSRPDITHLLFAMMPAYLLVVLLGEDAVLAAGRRSLPVSKRTAAAAFVAAAVGALAVIPTDLGENVAVFARQAGLLLTGRMVGDGEPEYRPLAAVRGGGVRLPADEAADVAAVVTYLRDATRPGEPVWAVPNEPMINFLADRPLASRYPLVLFAVTAGQRRDLIADVERSDLRFAVVNRRPTMVDGISSRASAPEVWNYVDTHFVEERIFGRFAVMRRRPRGRLRVASGSASCRAAFQL